MDGSPDGIATLYDFFATEGPLATASEPHELTRMIETRQLADSEANVGPWLASWNGLVFPSRERELEAVVRDGELSRSIYD